MRVVVILPDGASKYLSKIFNDDWMREHGLLGPGATLGTVADLIRFRVDNPVIAARAGDSVREVVALLKEHRVSQVPVLDGTRLLGAISEVDLLRYIVSEEESLDSPVGPLVEADFASASPATPLAEVQALLNEVRVVLVQVDGALVAVITKIDLIDYLARH